MATADLNHVLSRARRLAVGDSAAPPDAVLLARFVAQRDETAFAVLVARHGAMVFGVCRRVLHDRHDAEDACQATFLVLARRATAIRTRSALGPWLHGVAFRISCKLKRRLARRTAVPLSEGVAHAAGDDVSWREVRAVLDAEIRRLPERLQSPILLCYVQGKTRDEAAAELGWSVGTLRGRLDRGRELLRSRLARRGLALSAGLLGTIGTGESLSAAVAAAVVLSAIEPVATARGVAALAEGELRAMFIRKMKLSAAVVVAGFAVIAAVGSWAVHPAKAQPADPPASAKTDPANPVAAVPTEEAELRQRAGDADRIVVGEYKEINGKPHWSVVQTLKGPHQPIADYPIDIQPWKWDALKAAAGKPRQWTLFMRADEDGVGVPTVTAARPNQWDVAEMIADPSRGRQAEFVRNAIPLPEEWGAQTGGLRFGLRLRQTRVKAGEEVVAEIALKNVSQKNVAIKQRRYNIYDYWPTTEFEVRDPAGNFYLLAKPDGPISESDAPSAPTLKPGECYIHAVRLNRWPVDESRTRGGGPGHPAPFKRTHGYYLIKCRCDPWNDVRQESKGWLQSNELQLWVTADKPPAANPAGKLWAAMSVNQPIFREGHDTNLLQFSFTLVNDGDAAVDPKLRGYPRLFVNGKELDMSKVPFTGPRDKRFESLPAGDYLHFGQAMGSYFEKPGIYRVIWKGEGFEAPEVVFRVLPKK